jgi:hypothetical protein
VFYLDLKKGNYVATIKFKELDHSLSKKWAKVLKKHIDAGYPIAQPNRIYNLNNEWDELKIINQINQCIQTINNYKQFIDFKILSQQLSQTDSNILHHYFELMRGENDSPNEFYRDAPREIKKVIEEYNVLIHRWEDLGSYGRIVVHFKERPMFELDDEDYQHWTLNYEPGDIRLNYCHKGKTIWDCFKDGDDIVGDDNIRPQHRYSPDFNIIFGRGPGKTQAFVDWWERMSPKLNQLGFYQDDPKCAIGHAVIGKIQGDPDAVKKNILGATEILGIRYDNT